jgi:hypothetical protein
MKESAANRAGLLELSTRNSILQAERCLGPTCPRRGARAGHSWHNNFNCAVVENVYSENGIDVGAAEELLAQARRHQRAGLIARRGSGP